VCYDDGYTGARELGEIIHVLYYAADNGAAIISMSFGRELDFPDLYYLVGESIQEALDYAREVGVVEVAAAGNSNTDLCFFPACWPTVIGVTLHTACGEPG
jgi:subtilisin family serine protease